MAGRLAPGTLLSDTYRVVRLVGEGGMGEVYEATHSRLAGRYAVKVLSAEISSRPDIFQRFRREAEVTSRLRHPNIVQVVDFNQTRDGHPYLVMEYLEGTELAAEIGRVGAMPLARVLDIVGQVASALTAAHAQGIIHRDLKPQNIFLVFLPEEDREVAKVVDFGISKVREATTQLTQEAAIMGTPQYMAPEQAQGRLSKIDARTDEFALGAIAYELLTGRTPFQGEAVPAILYQVVHEQPDSIRQIVPSVPASVEAVVFKALSKRQDDRYPSVLDFHRDLMRAADFRKSIHPAETEAGPFSPSFSSKGPGEVSFTTLSSATGQVESSTLPPVAGSRKWLGVGLGVAMALAGVGFAALGLRGRNSAAPPRPAPPLAAPVIPNETPPTPTSVPAKTQPKIATVEIEDAPPGLQVTVDGVLQELPLALPFGPEIHRLSFEAPGFEPREIRVDGMREHRSIVLALRKSVAPTPSAADGKATGRRAATGGRSRRAETGSESLLTGKEAPVIPAKPPEKKTAIITDF